MDAARFLSELYSELEQIEQEIRFLERSDAGTETRWRLGPGLSMRELEPFRRDNPNASLGADRLFSLH